MKSMTCKQLGGACDVEFQADTFDQIAQASKNHGLEMFEKSDPDHLQAMTQMQEIMTDPKAMQDWMTQKQHEFDSLPQK